MRLLILDCETTGIPPALAGDSPKFEPTENAKIVELAGAIFDTEARAAIWCYGAIAPAEGRTPNDAVEINGITDQMLERAGAMHQLLETKWWAPFGFVCGSGVVDAVAAHKADFDRWFVERECDELLDADGRPLPWICTREDIVYPRQRGSKHLAHLAVDHGAGVAVQKHRALADVLLVCELLKTVEDLDEQVAAAMKPRALFAATGLPFERKDEAKTRGFTWDPDRRLWQKRLPFDTPLESTDERPFRVQMLEPVG